MARINYSNGYLRYSLFHSQLSIAKDYSSGVLNICYLPLEGTSQATKCRHDVRPCLPASPNSLWCRCRSPSGDAGCKHGIDYFFPLAQHYYL